MSLENDKPQSNTAPRQEPPKEPVVRRRDEHIDDTDINWRDEPVLGLFKAFPVSISQSGHANDLTVQFNVAMLPPASDLDSYEKAVPGMAEYIMKAADEQRHHRLAIEAQQVARSERRRDVGQIMSGLLAGTGLIGAIILGIYGNAWVAGVLAMVAVGGPLAAQTLAGALARQQASDGQPVKTRQQNS